MYPTHSNVFNAPTLSNGVVGDAWTTMPGTLGSRPGPRMFAWGGGLVCDAH